MVVVVTVTGMVVAVVVGFGGVEVEFCAMGFNGNRLKVQLRLALNRLKLLQIKKLSLSQQQRKEIATLLDSGRLESARIKVSPSIASFCMERPFTVAVFSPIYHAAFMFLFR